MRIHKVSCLGVVLVLASCGEAADDATARSGSAVRPISHVQAALTVSTNTETALQGLLNAASFLAESAAVAEMMSTLGAGTTECSSSFAAPICPSDGSPCTASTTVEQCTSTPPDLEEMRADLQSAIDELVEELNARFFSLDNVESEEEKVVTYLLGPEDLCGEIGSSTLAADGTYVETSMLDPECSADVERAQVRLRVTSPSEGNVDVTVLLTEQRYQPIVFELHQHRLAVTVDLDELDASIGALGEDLEGLESMTGQLQLELVENANLNYSLNLNVLTDLQVVINDDGNLLNVSLGENSPTTELGIDGNTQTISANYDYGRLRIAGPLQLFAELFEDSSSVDVVDEGSVIGSTLPVPVEPPPPVYTGMIEFLLGGLSGGFAFAGDTDLFQFTNLGLGDETTRLSHNGNTLLALDVNANQGRRFDVSVQSVADGELQFGFSPTLDVSLLLNFAHIADQLEIESTLLDDTLRFWFDGDDPAIITRDNELEVVTGTLHMSSTAAPEYNVDVAAGMCLLTPEDDSDIAAETDSDVAPLPAAPIGGIAPAEPVPAPPPEPVVIEETPVHFLSEFEITACQ